MRKPLVERRSASDGRTPRACRCPGGRASPRRGGGCVPSDRGIAASLSPVSWASMGKIDRNGNRRRAPYQRPSLNPDAADPPNPATPKLAIRGGSAAMIDPGASTFEGQTPMIRFLFALQLLLLRHSSPRRTRSRKIGATATVRATCRPRATSNSIRNGKKRSSSTAPPRPRAPSSSIPTAPLCRPGRRPRAALWHRRRPRRFSVAGPAEDLQQEGVAGLDPAAGNDPAPALSAALHGRRPRQPARCARALSRRHRLSHPRNQHAADHRHRGLLGMSSVSPIPM